MARNDRKGGRFSRRQFMQTAAAAAAASGTLGLARTSHAAVMPPGRSEPDLFLFNGKIHTMDAHNKVVSSVWIKDGRFVEVGNAMRPESSARTKMIDLGGRIVVPGIIDNHNHIVLMGNRPGFHTPLENAHSVAEALAIYAARAKGLPSGAWITTIGGFHFNHLYANPLDKTTGRFPTQAELDGAVPNNPLFLMISFTGPGMANSRAATTLRANGVVVGADGSVGTGFPSSECTKALLFLRQTLLKNAEERRRSTLDAMSYAASLGVTTHIDQGA